MRWDNVSSSPKSKTKPAYPFPSHTRPRMPTKNSVFYHPFFPPAASTTLFCQFPSTAPPAKLTTGWTPAGNLFNIRSRAHLRSFAAVEILPRNGREQLESLRSTLTVPRPPASRHVYQWARMAVCYQPGQVALLLPSYLTPPSRKRRIHDCYTV